MVTSISKWLNKASLSLKDSSESPRLDAELLVTHLLKKDRTYLYTHGDDLLSTQQIGILQSLLKQRIDGKPIAQITNRKNFWSLNLLVNEHTLIPRPETEILVTQSLKKVEQISKPIILDLGTGSGAIALALAYERPDAQIIATDISKHALDIARKNQQQLNLMNIEWILSNWYEQIPPMTADIIVSNPPYISHQDPYIEEAVKTFEPHQALFAKDNGLHDIKLIINQGKQYLKKGGTLLLEIGFEQYQDVSILLKKSCFKNIQLAYDLNHLPRVVIANY